MKRFTFHTLISLLLPLTAVWLVNVSTQAAESSKSSPDQSLAAFKIISERNIFNANRRPRTAQAPPPVRTERPARIEAFSLIGTMLYDAQYAIFDGTDPVYKKVLKPGDTIAGHKIVEVLGDSVKLELEQNQVELPLGMQMRRQEQERWQVVVGSVTTSGASSSVRDRSSEVSGRDRAVDSRRDRSAEMNRRDRGAEGTRRDRGFTRNGGSTVVETEAKPAEETNSSGSADEVLKRLMQKREQELSK